MAKVYILMGASGCGKSTIGEALASAAHGTFIDADHLHSPQNVAKMRTGTPLTDEDRAEWLKAVAHAIAQGQEGAHPLFIACSALKKSYRDLLRNGNVPPVFIWLHGPESLLRQRLEERQGHYMPASLLRSQLEALEAPTDDESILTIDISPPADTIVRNLLNQLAPL
jgi:gluconokinase